MVKENGKLVRWKRFAHDSDDWWLTLWELELGIRVTCCSPGYYRFEISGDTEYLSMSCKKAKSYAEQELKRRLKTVEIS